MQLISGQEFRSLFAVLEPKARKGDVKAAAQDEVRQLATSSKCDVSCFFSEPVFEKYLESGWPSWLERCCRVWCITALNPKHAVLTSSSCSTLSPQQPDKEHTSDHTGHDSYRHIFRGHNRTGGYVCPEKKYRPQKR